jgi:hypothetical protein
MSIKYKVSPVFIDDKYCVETEIIVNDYVSKLTRIIIDTEDQLVRQRLIDLGWTPPKDK